MMRPTFLEVYFCLGATLRSLWSSGSLLSRFLTLQILTSQCSEVNASSRCLNLISLLPISALRVRSKPGGVRKSSWDMNKVFHFNNQRVASQLCVMVKMCIKKCLFFDGNHSSICMLNMKLQSVAGQLSLTQRLETVGNSQLGSV